VVIVHGVENRSTVNGVMTVHPEPDCRRARRQS
jgi:hypothetical protein